MAYNRYRTIVTANHQRTIIMAHGHSHGQVVHDPYNAYLEPFFSRTIGQGRITYSRFDPDTMLYEGGHY